jgi:hypothetical protein
MVLAVTVEMLVDPVVVDGLAANGTFNHSEDEWTTILRDARQRDCRYRPKFGAVPA